MFARKFCIFVLYATRRTATSYQRLDGNCWITKETSTVSSPHTIHATDTFILIHYVNGTKEASHSHFPGLLLLHVHRHIHRQRVYLYSFIEKSAVCVIDGVCCWLSPSMKAGARPFLTTRERRKRENFAPLESVRPEMKGDNEEHRSIN